MISNKSFKLIEGEFTPEEAQEILINLFKSKIRFHDFRNLRSQISRGKPDANSRNKSEELNGKLKKILNIIHSAAENGEILNIHSDVTISSLKK